MNLKVTKPQHISKESLDSLIKIYQDGRITHGSFIDSLISRQKRLIINDICRPGDGAVAGEVLIRRMENAGIEITI